MNNIKTLTVYLGSSGHARPVFKDAARALGQIIGEKNMRLTYGGMDAGLMGLLAKGALDGGAHVTGIIPRKLKDSERILPGLSETIMVEDLWDRKKRMFQMADAVISLPGGFGTLDESLEMLYWAQLGLHIKPLILVNVEGYWNDLIAYLNTLPDFDPRFLIVIENTEDIFPALENYQPPTDIYEEPDHYPHFEDEITRGTDEPIIIDIPSVENSYYAACALGLKQLHKHKRAIGFLNQDGEFDNLLKWITHAAKETFITRHCLELFTVGSEEAALHEALKHQKFIEIDLHGAKWGPREG
ncbi:MAG: TIGR00730 family Rossman fold protein [Rhodospirillales bacterium]|nr:TIGR00730 family Rossman fold protein [Alphaproteobacteria bacterium]USO05848.1 MAG: TIGR00730 family Rossman fold protein [Rhodospirillales bacterium]